MPRAARRSRQRRLLSRPGAGARLSRRDCGSAPESQAAADSEAAAVVMTVTLTATGSPGTRIRICGRRFESEFQVSGLKAVFPV